MTHLCGAPTETTNGPCRRRLRHSVHCHDHRVLYPWVSESLAANGPVPPPGQPSKRHTGRPSRGEREAIRLAVDGITEGRTDALSTWLADTVGADALDRLTNTARAKTCVTLADTANYLDELLTRAHQAVGEFTFTVVRDLSGAFLLAQVAGELARRAAFPHEWALVEAARALRLLGVHLCTVLGRLNRCECLRDVIRQGGHDALEEGLGAALS